MCGPQPILLSRRPSPCAERGREMKQPIMDALRFVPCTAADPIGQGWRAIQLHLPQGSRLQLTWATTQTERSIKAVDALRLSGTSDRRGHRDRGFDVPTSENPTARARSNVEQVAIGLSIRRQPRVRNVRVTPALAKSPERPELARARSTGQARCESPERPRKS
jgi:hypothetical protein